jgi:hypothetical protein
MHGTLHGGPLSPVPGPWRLGLPPVARCICGANFLHCTHAQQCKRPSKESRWRQLGTPALLSALLRVPALHAGPAAQGYALPHLTRRLDIAGRHVTLRLAELLRRRGHAAGPAAGLDAVRRLKERLCYVAADLPREQQARARERPRLEPCRFKRVSRSDAAAGAWTSGSPHMAAVLWEQVCCQTLQGSRQCAAEGGSLHGPAEGLLTRRLGSGRPCACPSALRLLPAALVQGPPAPHGSPGARCVPPQLARETTVRSASYTLPDGRVIRVGAERFMARPLTGLLLQSLAPSAADVPAARHLCERDALPGASPVCRCAPERLHRWQAPEALFTPSLVDLDRPGIAEMVHCCIQVPSARPAQLSAAVT